MNTPLGFPFGFLANDNTPLDAKYYSLITQQPYTSVANANTELASGVRYKGLTINIVNEEYWYKDGILDTDLVKKELGDKLQGDNYRTVLGDKGTALLNGVDLLAKLAEVVALQPTCPKTIVNIEDIVFTNTSTTATYTNCLVQLEIGMEVFGTSLTTGTTITAFTKPIFDWETGTYIKNSGTITFSQPTISTSTSTEYVEIPLVSLYVCTGIHKTITSINIPKYVNIIGIGAKENIVLEIESSGILINNHENYYKLENLTINANIQRTGFSGGNTRKSDFGVWNNLIFLKPHVNQQTSYEGRYSNLDCHCNNILNGVLRSKVSNSNFQNFSCGYYQESGNITPLKHNGYIENCTGLENCFFVYSIFIQTNNNITTTFGKAVKCVSGNFSFGYVNGSYSASPTYIFENCKLNFDYSSLPQISCFGFNYNVSISSSQNIEIRNTEFKYAFFIQNNNKLTGTWYFKECDFKNTITLPNAASGIIKFYKNIFIDSNVSVNTILSLNPKNIISIGNIFNKTNPYDTNITNSVIESAAGNIKDVNIT